MTKKAVIGVILVLVCSCLSLGNGDQPFQRATRDLRKRYSSLSTFLKHPDVLLPLGTIRQHLRDLQDKNSQAQTWIQETSGYSHEQLSNPPESFKDENVLKLATEYHLLKTGWYHVRFTTLKRAAERDEDVDQSPDQIEDYPSIYNYPSIYTCRRFALEAADLSKYHMRKYRQYYKALSKKKRQDLMMEIKFPNYIPSQELNDQFQEHENYVGSVWQSYKYAQSDDILNIETQLDNIITRLLKRKNLVKSSAAQSAKSIYNLLNPKRMKLNANLMLNLRNCFSATDLSQPPDKASRSDVQFLEVAWLFNRYKSLWHEIRCIQFQKFLGQSNNVGITFERVETTLKADKKNFLRYESLYKEYYELLNKFQPDKKAIAQHLASAAASGEIDSQTDLSADESLERMQWSGKRKRTVLKRFRNTILQGTFETAENQPLNELFLENEKSLLNEPVTSETVSTELNDQTEQGAAYTAKRYKTNEEQLGFHQEDQLKSSYEEHGTPDFDCSTEKLSNEDEDNPPSMEVVPHSTITVPTDFDPRHEDETDPLFMEVFQECTIGVPADFDLQLGATIELDEPLSETEEDLRWIDSLPQLHNPKLNDANQMDSIVPSPRLEATESEENNSQLCPNIDGAHQLPPEKYCSESTKTLESLSSSYRFEPFDF